MIRLTSEAIYNKNLFSNHYLENLIQKNPEWNESDHEEAFRRIKDIWQAELPHLEGRRESQLEEIYFRKIFRILLPDFEVQEITESQDFPDYAFFSDKQVLKEAHKNRGSRSLYKEAFAIGEVKKWNIELDRFGRDKHNKRKNPSFQIWLYLHETEPKWGILSNGRMWRLYNEDRPLDCYYQVDLVKLLESNDVEGFKYFYYFFRAEAFLQIDGRTALLERVLEGSLDYARDIGDSLKENVYRAMKRIADGFFHWPHNGLNLILDDTRFDVQKSTMRLLYRLLFLLYAEGRGLLDLGNERYRNTCSFDRLKKEIKSRKDGPFREYYTPATTTIWSRLKDMFRLISEGSEAQGIDKGDFCVPAYNGGLFDPARDPNLENWEIGDTHLADAIDLLARSEVEHGGRGFVDYSTLEIRHLGSIYEGLLEFELMIAPKDMVVRGMGKKRDWVGLDEFNKNRSKTKAFSSFNEYDRAGTGELYLATRKGERKATGSYYTPSYIVNYITETVVGPIVEGKWKQAETDGNSLAKATLSIKVLDPAMGSGHFLVGATEYLAAKLLNAVTIDIGNDLLKDDGHFTSEWAKREVVSNCIYGVDLNELAVELAKVSLWLTTIGKDRPLSFLDHRLKRGNSLIGTDLLELPWHPSKGKSKNQRRLDIPEGFIRTIVDTISKISSFDDDSLENIRKKEEMLRKLEETREYDMIRTLADVRASIYFGNEIDVSTYGRYSGDAHWSSEEEWSERRKRGLARKARDVSRERKFFHWELEFPEVFFEKDTLKPNPGFDAVVGNPPYFDIQTHLDDSEKEYLRNYEVHTGSNDVMYYFYEISFSLLKSNGRFGMITSRYFQEAKFGSNLRGLLSKYKIERIVDFGSDVKVFFLSSGEEVTIHTIILVAQKSDPTGSTLVMKLREWPVEMGDIGGLISWVRKKGEMDSYMTRKGLVFSIPSNRISSKPWNFNPPAYDRIIKKTLIKSHRLGDYEDDIGLYDIVKSIESGKDKIEIEGDKVGVYRLTPREVEELGIEENLLLPLVKTTHMRRYSIKPHEEFLLYVTPDTDIDKYPKAKRHLSGFKSELAERHDIKNTNLPWFSLSNLRNRGLFEKESDKILWPMVSPHNRFCIKPMQDRLAWSADVYYGVPRAGTSISPYYVLALCNSELLEFFHSRIAKSTNWGHSYSATYVSQYPIRSITFSTDVGKRKENVQQLKQLYEEHLTVGEAGPILRQIEHHLSTEPETSDAIHDFLDKLGRSMTGYHDERDKAISDFLDWLGNYLGTRIGDLSGRSKIQEFYDHEFDDLMRCLRRNRKHLNKDPDIAEIFVRLKENFGSSKERIDPITQRMAMTEVLIDQIVYKLYDIANSEAELVKKSIE